METAEKILEDCLNDVGMSIDKQLLPHNIKISKYNKVNKAIVKAMKIFARIKCKEQKQLCYKWAQRTVLVKKDEQQVKNLNIPDVMLSLPADIETKIHRQFETDRDNIHAPFWDTEHIIRENTFKKEGAMWLLKKIKAGNGA